MSGRIFFVIISAAFLISVSAVFAEERLVPSEYSTIQAAIDDCNDGDVVIVEPNVYTGTGNRDIDFLGKAITVRSEYPEDPCVVASTVIDCNGSPNEPHRGFYFYNNEDANSILQGFTIINGYVNWGGGIRCDNSSPTITNCVISGNEASSYGGGGLFCSESNLKIMNCSFTNNSTSNGEGGGMFIVDESSPMVTGCAFTGNSAYFGGGIMCDFNSSPAVTNCTIANNSAVSGAGIYNNYYSNATVKNCLFYGNLTPNNAGGIYNADNSNATVTGCTFSRNSAGWGGGMVVYNSYPTITNCIFWDNTPSQQIYLYAGSTPIVSYSNVQGGWPGTCNIDADPCFVDADSNDFHLAGGISPCFNAGDPNYIAMPPPPGPGFNETDIDGDARVIDGRVDIGADEVSDCMAETNWAYETWVSVGKPDCWCYERHCYGDTDGKKQLLFWVYSNDLALLKSAYAKTDAVLETVEYNGVPGICADFDIKKSIIFRVYANDLAILKSYYAKPSVPSCGNPPDANYNFWLYSSSSLFDTNPPVPVEWEVLPYETGGGLEAYANMTAVEATDPEGNGPVMYYFECVDVPAYNSGWTTEREWNNYPIGRSGKLYQFHFKVRDNLLNESSWSTSEVCYP